MNPKKPRRWCAAGCSRQGNTAGAVYCSTRCQHVAQYRERVSRLEAGQYPPNPTNSSFLRRYLVERDGEACTRCGWSERNCQTRRVMVEVEHIDGDWRNNRPDNLTLLCPNCHSLTATYRALNRGRGRPNRRWKPAGSGDAARPRTHPRPVERRSSHQLLLVAPT